MNPRSLFEQKPRKDQLNPLNASSQQSQRQKQTLWKYCQVQKHKMRKSFIVFPASLLLLLLVTNFCMAAPVPTNIIPLADTTENIHPGLAEEGNVTPASERGVIGYVWGAKIPTDPRTIHKSFYTKFDRASGYPGNTSFPVYYDKSWFLAHHPNWLVYLCDKKTLAYEFGDPNVPLDITNPSVLQFMLQNWIYPAFAYEYDGIAFDNVNLDNTASQGRCGVWMTDSHGSKVWKYLYGDAQSIHGPAYTKTVVNWAKFMYSAIHNYQASSNNGNEFLS